MKITAFETLHADGGGRVLDFLKVSTDEGLVGWSEYNEGFGGLGVTQVIERLAPVLIGKDPRTIEAHVALMQALRARLSGLAMPTYMLDIPGGFGKVALESAPLEKTATGYRVRDLRGTWHPYP